MNGFRKMCGNFIRSSAAVLAFASISGCGGGGGNPNPQAVIRIGTPQTTSTASFSTVVLGVGTHIMGQDMTISVPIMKQAGLQSVRDDLTWQYIEPQAGVLAIPDNLNNYNASLSQAGLSPLMILDYSNSNYGVGKPVTDAAIQAYANYAKFSAASLADRAGYFEIWNEWNNKTLPNSPDSYFNLVKAAAPQIKSGNSKALVLAGSSNIWDSWTADLVKLGVLKYVDGVTVHPYVQCEPDPQPENLIYVLNNFAANLQVANGGAEVPLYVTEIGWPTNTGACGSTPEVAADYLARALLLIRTIPSVRGVWWYDLKDDGSDPTNMEDNFGLLDVNYQPKPAFTALMDLAPLFHDPKHVTKVASTDPDLFVVEVDSSSGEKIFALWTDNGKTAQAVATFTLASQGKVSKLVVGTGQRSDLAVSPGTPTATVSANGTPQLIFGADKLTLSKVSWQ